MQCHPPTRQQPMQVLSSVGELVEVEGRHASWLQASPCQCPFPLLGILLLPMLGRWALKKPAGLAIGGDCSNPRRSWADRRSRGRRSSEPAKHAEAYTHARLDFGAAFEPPRFLFYLLYIGSRHAGHAGHDARTARHAPLRAAPSPSSERAARLAQPTDFVRTCARQAPVQDAPNRLGLKRTERNGRKANSILTRTCQTYSTTPSRNSGMLLLKS